MKDLTASIVAYKNPADILAQTIRSFLSATQHSKLLILDNSPTDYLKYLADDPRVSYIFNGNNLGFGAAHNIALKQTLSTSKYHLVLNPDVYFEPDVIGKLYAYMERAPEVGLVMPKVLYPDGRLQPLCKLLPSPKTLIARRFLSFFSNFLRKENYTYELHFTGYDKIVNVPFLSGCFMFLRVETLQKVGLFDERFFLYTEDTDLSRRIHKLAKTVFFPETVIYHYYAKGPYKNWWLLIHNMRSAIKYFNKWGWTNDQERKEFNDRVMRSILQLSHDYAS